MVVAAGLQRLYSFVINYLIKSPRPLAEANAVAFAVIIRQGLGNGNRLIGSRPRRWIKCCEADGQND